MKIIKHKAKTNWVIGYTCHEAVVSSPDQPDPLDVAAAVNYPKITYGLWDSRIYKKYTAAWIIRWKSSAL